MTAGLIGKVYGVSCGVLCIVLASCSTPAEQPASPVLPTAVEVVAGRTNTRLTKREMLHAIAARTRASRLGRAPSENLMRVYDRDGNVVRESVKQEGKWVDRPSTLPKNLSAEPLRNFLLAGETMLYSSESNTTQAATGTYSGPNGTVTATDSMFTIPSSTVQVKVHDTNNSDDALT
jgi:hypothetical protein